MKFFAYLLCFYLTILTALPSVRVMKMEFFEKNQSSCKTNNDSQSSCERGNVIMNLNFSPSQCINAQFIPFILVIPLFEPIKKEKSNYEKIFISQYISSIWQPPKVISLV